MLRAARNAVITAMLGCGLVLASSGPHPFQETASVSLDVGGSAAPAAPQGPEERRTPTTADSLRPTQRSSTTATTVIAVATTALSKAVPATVNAPVQAASSTVPATDEVAAGPVLAPSEIGTTTVPPVGPTTGSSAPDGTVPAASSRDWANDSTLRQPVDPPPTSPPSVPEPTVPAPPPVAPAPVADPGGPLLIKHGWDLPRPAWIRDNVAQMEALGFDGVVTTIGGLGNRINSQTPVSYEEIRAALAPLAGVRFTTMRHNFLIVYRGDHRIFDDNTTPRANFANLARAAREFGFEGIVFDNESYDGPSWQWPNAAPGVSLAEAQAQAQRRGREAMAAMIAEWPDITVLTMFGPWVSDPATAAFWSGQIPYNDIAWANQLMGPFTLGMVEASIGTPASIVDGGEVYTLRTPAQFELAHQWLDSGFAAQSTLVPDAMRGQYPQATSVAFGVYDRPVIGQPMDPAIWQATLTAALARTDKYVWAYTESYDWWGTGWPSARVPRPWIDATHAALATVRS